MNKQRIKRVALLSILGFFLGTGIAWHQIQQETKPGYQQAQISPAAGVSVAGAEIGGAFTLINHNGVQVTDKDYDGSYRLVFFGFTHCPEVCPTELQKMANVLNALGPKAGKVKPLFISVDPERDTPSVMKDYVSMFHPSIIGLTGSDEQLKAVQKAYKVYAAKVNDETMNDYTMNHSSFTFFMGPDGQMIELFTSGDTPSDIVKTMMKEL